MPAFKRAADRLDHFVQAAVGYGAGIDRLPSRGLFAQLGDIHVAEISQHQRARDRGRAQHQHIDRVALGRQRQPFAHAEAVLLVDHRQRQRLKHHIVLDQRVGADQQINLAGRQARKDIAPFLALLTAGQDRNAQARAFGKRCDGLDVLAGKDFGRRHQGRLFARFGHGGGGEQRNHRLARADVALKQAQHPHRLPQVVADRGSGLLLGGGQRVGKRVDDLVAQMPVAGVPASRRPPQAARGPTPARVARQAIRRRRGATRMDLRAGCRSVRSGT